jgi:hypothetical protein
VHAAFLQVDVAGNCAGMCMHSIVNCQGLLLSPGLAWDARLAPAFLLDLWQLCPVLMDPAAERLNVLQMCCGARAATHLNVICMACDVDTHMLVYVKCSSHWSEQGAMLCCAIGDVPWPMCMLQVLLGGNQYYSSCAIPTCATRHLKPVCTLPGLSNSSKPANATSDHR